MSTFELTTNQNCMKHIALIAVFASFVISCTNPGTEPLSESSLEAKVDSLVQPYLDSSKVVGMGVAVFRGDKPLLLKGYGFADLEWNVKLPVDASFEIGSVTKQFTAASILQLVEQGKLSLDDDVTKYLEYNTLGKKVTIRQLLSHTSGIKGYTELPFFEKFSQQKHSRDTLLRIVEKAGFDFDPGEALIYNNTAFFMLGLIIEKLSGISYEEYVQKNLFEKAGMTNSYYCSESKIIANRAHGYNILEEGLMRAGYLDHTWPYAAGSLCSTPGDLVKWNSALHHGKILSDKMYKEMLTPVSLNDGTITHYAKGITVTMDGSKRLIEHGGGIDGFLSQNSYYPDDDVSIVVLVNTTGPVSPREVADHIANFVFGKSTIEYPQFAGDQSKYIGTYIGRGRGDGLTVNISKNDSTISVQYGEGKIYPLRYASDNTWAIGNSTFQFAGSGDILNELRIDQIYGYYILKRKSK